MQKFGGGGWRGERQHTFVRVHTTIHSTYCVVQHNTQYSSSSSSSSSTSTFHLSISLVALFYPHSLSAHAHRPPTIALSPYFSSSPSASHITYRISTYPRSPYTQYVVRTWYYRPPYRLCHLLLSYIEYNTARRRASRPMMPQLARPKQPTDVDMAGIYSSEHVSLNVPGRPPAVSYTFVPRLAVTPPECCC